VRYPFLVPWLLERAGSDVHSAYGGARALPAEVRYGARGRTLAYLMQWIDQARARAEATATG
jgi:hypothetical protein